MSLSQIELVWVRVRVEWECFEWIWEKITRCLNQDGSVWNQHSRWLPSSSWVRMNEWSVFCGNGGNQSWQVWVSLRGNTKMAESNMAKFKMAEFKMAVIIKLRWEWMNLSQIELVWVRVRVEWECFWVNLREDNKVSESKMAVSESIQHESKNSNMAAIIKLSQNEWVKCFFVEMVGTNLGKCEWLWEEILRWLNPTWPNQDGRIQDGCHHQVKWEWMSLSQIELVWVRVRVEWECFEWIWEKITRCLNPRWQCQIQDGRIQDGCHHQVESEWMSEVFFVEMVGTNLGKCEWLWEEIMSLKEKSKMSEWVNIAKFKMAEFKLAVIIKSEWVWVRLN